MGHQLQVVQVSRFDGSFCRLEKELFYMVKFLKQLYRIYRFSTQNEILFKISALGLLVFVKYT